MSEVCITLRKRQYSISRHTDYDFDRTTDMPLEKFCRCQKVLHDPRHLSRPPCRLNELFTKAISEACCQNHKSVPCYTIQALAWLCRLITVSHNSSYIKKKPCGFLYSFSVQNLQHHFQSLESYVQYPAVLYYIRQLFLNHSYLLFPDELLILP